MTNNSAVNCLGATRCFRSITVISGLVPGRTWKKLLLLQYFEKSSPSSLLDLDIFEYFVSSVLHNC